MKLNTKQLEWFGAKGPEAARLRRRKYALVRKFGFPQNLLPGSLCQSLRRCGKPGCHCVDGEGHPMWSLTLSLDGDKHVEPIPMSWAPELQRLVEEGQRFREALREMLSINAKLLQLYRKEQRTKRPKPRRRTFAGRKSSQTRK